MFDSSENEISSALHKHWWKAALGLFLPVAACSSTYYVNPSDVAHIRRMGTVITAPNDPVHNGLHFKAPLIDKVDRMQVSISTMQMDTFSVNTIDNQEIKLNINLTFQVPANSAYFLLYNVGGTGNIDIDSTIKPIVMNKAAAIFSGTNTNAISSNFGTLQNRVSNDVRDFLQKQFHINLISLQIAHIDYSPVFRRTNDVAVSSKNQAISEQNKVLVSRAQADQLIATAHGDAEASRERGQGEADRLKLLVNAAGGAENYTRIKQSEAWKGNLPQVVVTSGGAGSVPVMLQLPKP